MVHFHGCGCRFWFLCSCACRTKWGKQARSALHWKPLISKSTFKLNSVWVPIEIEGRAPPTIFFSGVSTAITGGWQSLPVLTDVYQRTSQCWREPIQGWRMVPSVWQESNAWACHFSILLYFGEARKILRSAFTKTCWGNNKATQKCQVACMCVSV